MLSRIEQEKAFMMVEKLQLKRKQQEAYRNNQTITFEARNIESDNCFLSLILYTNVEITVINDKDCGRITFIWWMKGEI